MMTQFHRLQVAECREHKRWIERENARLRAKAKKEETRRLREFVDRAYALDPRVNAKKEEARAEREAKKAEKARVKQEREDAERRAAEEAAAAKAAADEVAKKAAADAKRIKCVRRPTHPAVLHASRSAHPCHAAVHTAPGRQQRAASARTRGGSVAVERLLCCVLRACLVLALRRGAQLRRAAVPACVMHACECHCVCSVGQAVARGRCVQRCSWRGCRVV